jgi:hypothetical protein
MCRRRLPSFASSFLGTDASGFLIASLQLNETRCSPTLNIDDVMDYSHRKMLSFSDNIFLLLVGMLSFSLDLSLISPFFCCFAGCLCCWCSYLGRKISPETRDCISYKDTTSILGTSSNSKTTITTSSRRRSGIYLLQTKPSAANSIHPSACPFTKSTSKRRLSGPSFLPHRPLRRKQRAHPRPLWPFLRR